MARGGSGIETALSCELGAYMEQLRQASDPELEKPQYEHTQTHLKASPPTYIRPSERSRRFLLFPVFIRFFRADLPLCTDIEFSPSGGVTVHEAGAEFSSSGASPYAT